MVATSVSGVACGLVLGVDDVPPVPSRAGGRDSGHEARMGVMDAGPERGVDGAYDRDVLDVTGEPEVLVGQLPMRSGGPTTSAAEINFAVRDLWLGETDQTPAFTLDGNAWATFGYNIDGKVTDSLSTDVCTLAPGALSTVQVDGNDGADNSFGANLVDEFSIAFGGSLSSYLSSKVAMGSFTFLFDLTGLTTSPTQTNTGLTAEIFGGARFPGTPTFTLADNWPIDPGTLADGVTLSHGAKTSFSDSYVANGTWVSGSPTDIVFALELANKPLVLKFHQAVATFQHSLDDAGAHHARHGRIAGILKADELITAITSVVGDINKGQYCGLVRAFAAKVTASQDILEDGTNAEGLACSGISFGVAFEGDEIQPPSVVAPARLIDASAPPCPSDAGDAGDGRAAP